MKKEKKEKLLLLLEEIIRGCHSHPGTEQWITRFQRDRDELVASNNLEREGVALAQIRRALWGGMGAFCDGGAPTPDLEKLGNEIYSLISKLK